MVKQYLDRMEINILKDSVKVNALGFNDIKVAEFDSHKSIEVTSILNKDIGFNYDDIFIINHQYDIELSFVNVYQGSPIDKKVMKDFIYKGCCLKQNSSGIFIVVFYFKSAEDLVVI